MYKSIYVPVDNSDYSNRAVARAVALGKAFSAKLVGCHVYAARLHDYRFKQMEYTLPEEYLDEVELERQRKIHDSLDHDGPQAHLRQLSRRHVAPLPGVEPRLRAADDGREASHRDPQGSRRLAARPGRHRRPGDRARPRQRDRLGLRARRPPMRPRRLGGQAPPGAGRAGAGHDPGRHRRKPPVVRRAHDRHRPGPHVRQEGRDDRRLRSLPALLRLQRHRRRPHRAGGEGLPLRGAEPAPRGDHRHRARADLSVSSRGGRADGEGDGRARSRRRSSTARPSRRSSTTRARRIRGSSWWGGSASTARRTRRGSGATRRTFSAPRPATSSCRRVSRCRGSTCAPRRASDGRPKPRSG